MGSDVSIATAFRRACFAEIWIFYFIFCRFNRIVKLGIEYFDNFEHYCFAKYDFYLNQSVTSLMTLWKFKCKL